MCGAYLLIRSCDIVLLYRDNVYVLHDWRVITNFGGSGQNMDLRYDDNIILPSQEQEVDSCRLSLCYRSTSGTS